MRAKLTEKGREWFTEVNEKTGSPMPWGLNEVIEASKDDDGDWMAFGIGGLVYITKDSMEEVSD